MSFSSGGVCLGPVEFPMGFFYSRRRFRLLFAYLNRFRKYSNFHFDKVSLDFFYFLVGKYKSV